MSTSVRVRAVPALPCKGLRGSQDPQAFLQDIDSGIMVTVHMVPADAVHGTHLQVFHLRMDGTAGAAGLAGGEPPAHTDEMFPTVQQLILEHLQEHPVSVIHGGLPVAKAFVGQGLHIQVFHTDNVVLIGYLSRQFVQVVQPLVRGMAVDPAYFPQLFQVIVGFSFPFPGTLLPGQAALGFCQFLLGFPVVFMGASDMWPLLSM